MRLRTGRVAAIPCAEDGSAPVAAPSASSRRVRFNLLAAEK